VVGSANNPTLDLQLPWKFGGYSKIALRRTSNRLAQSGELQEGGVPSTDSPGLQ
jgi:hypothetical protein